MDLSVVDLHQLMQQAPPWFDPSLILSARSILASPHP